MVEPESFLHQAYRWAAVPLEPLLKQSSDLMRMVASGGPSTLHTLAAVLARREAEARADPATWADRLAHAPRTELLQEAYQALPPGFLAALAKLGYPAAPRETYGALHLAFAVPEFTLVLRRRKKISPEFVALLSVPEARRLHPKILTQLAFDDAEGVEALAEALALRVITPPWSEHLDALAACDTPQRLLRWFEYRWEKPFPAPPWAGDDLLEPITDPESLRRIGREMRNCLADQVVEVGRGSDFYYATRGAPRIAVGLHLRAGRWHATQILQARNRRPKAEARKEVLRRLAAAGIPVDIDFDTFNLLERVLDQEDEGIVRFQGGRRLR